MWEPPLRFLNFNKKVSSGNGFRNKLTKCLFFSKGKIWEVIGILLKHLTNYAHLDSFGNWKKRALHQKKGDVHVNASQKLMEPLNLLQINHFSRKLLHSEIHPRQGRGSDNQPINFFPDSQDLGEQNMAGFVWHAPSMGRMLGHASFS